MQNDYQFRLDFDVRDYECDIEGIVNNAVYLHYLEHTRHAFLKGRGIDFAEMAERGVNLVVTRIEIDYLFPLRSGDRFWTGLNMTRVSRLRFGFMQDIYRLSDQKPILRAKVIGTAIDDQGKPCLPQELANLLDGAST